jgi:hypothetical protein
MRRFMVNRWWAFALAMVLSVAGVVALPAKGRADGGPSRVDEPPLPAWDPTASAGDPDVPINTGKQAWKPAARRFGSPSGLGNGRGAGDAQLTPIAWSYSFRIALRVFRLYVMRF